MTYIVQSGETIRQVTTRLGCTFKDLRRQNPEALDRTADGRWFLKAGAKLDSHQGFSKILAQAKKPSVAPQPPVTIQSASATSVSGPASESVPNHRGDAHLLAGISSRSKALMSKLLDQAKTAHASAVSVEEAEVEDKAPTRIWRLSQLAFEGGSTTKSDFAEDLSRVNTNPGAEEGEMKVKTALSPGLNLSLSVTRRHYTQALNPASADSDGDTAVSFGLTFRF